MSALHTLASYVEHACQQETLSGLARRLGLPKNYVFRACHPGELAPGGRVYSPPLHRNTIALLDGLGLTVAPRDDSVPTVAHVCMMIGRMDCHPVAKSMAIDAVHRAGMVPPQDPDNH